jgi:hypothetical protein
VKLNVSKYIPKKMTKIAGRSVLKAKKNSPHILFGLGVTGVIGGTVLACRATLKLERHVTAFEEEVTENKEHANGQDMAYIYGKHTGKIVALYAPAVAVGGLGLICLTGSHVQLTKRNGALTVAYAGMLRAYDEYRSRVRDEVGEEKEVEIFHGVHSEKTIVNGKAVEVKTVDVNKLSQYTRIFDESNANYVKDAEINRVFIQCQQNYFNHLLQVRGHVFLNEVYQHLGFEHSRAGSIVGWAINKNGDNYIDFGLFEAHSARFVNGDERAIVLDFNVDGVIWDLID